MGNSYPVFFSSMVAFLLSSPSIYSWQQGIDAVGGWSTILSCGTSLMIACAGFMKQLFVRKEITYDVILDTGINSKNGIFRFIMIEIINTGNENIAKEDFVHPIEIDLKGRDVSLHSHPEILQEDGVIIPTELFSQFFTLVASDKIKLGTFLFQKKKSSR